MRLDIKLIVRVNDSAPIDICDELSGCPRATARAAFVRADSFPLCAILIGCPRHPVELLIFVEVL
jgi:hypothetical protein